MHNHDGAQSSTVFRIDGQDTSEMIPTFPHALGAARMDTQSYASMLLTPRLCDQPVAAVQISICIGGAGLAQADNIPTDAIEFPRHVIPPFAVVHAHVFTK